MQKLGRNMDGYQGETIDIRRVLEEISEAARVARWTDTPIRADNGLELQGWHRGPAQPTQRVYISAGIHGDEPAGPLAIRQLLREDYWADGVEVWLCPCLNPTGFPLNRRESVDGFDLNREYLHLEAPETRAHVAWLKSAPPFDVGLCLHEDWESLGFYLYEINPNGRPSHAEQVIQRVSTVCPIDLSPEIEDRPAVGGIIRPDVDPQARPRWPEAFWLLYHKTRHCYTLEAPSDFAMATRIAALVSAVRTVVETPLG